MSAPSPSASSILKFYLTTLLDEVENFTPPSLFFKDMCSQSIILQPCSHFGSKREMEEQICRHTLLTEKAFGLQAPPIFLTFAPLFIWQRIYSEPGVSQSQRTNTQRGKRNKILV